MTKDEIIEVLCNKGIITLIGSEYLLTEKYKELLTSPNLVLEKPLVETKKLDSDSILDGRTNGSDWPIEIIESSGRTRATIIMDLCEVPNMAKKGYRLRGMTNEAINILGNIIASEVDPSTFLDAIRIYYKYTEMPKSFKNFLLEGDVVDIYQEHIEGTLKSSLVNNGDVENRQEWR